MMVPEGAKVIYSAGFFIMVSPLPRDMVSAKAVKTQATPSRRAQLEKLLSLTGYLFGIGELSGRAPPGGGPSGSRQSTPPARSSRSFGGGRATPRSLPPRFRPRRVPARAPASRLFWLPTGCTGPRAGRWGLTCTPPHRHFGVQAGRRHATESPSCEGPSADTMASTRSAMPSLLAFRWPPSATSNAAEQAGLRRARTPKTRRRR